jgi:[glutamine synthetase] adenylyltransferase / [glutamine synthetase]-adenylyl-L-tyrosine phosphorylase
MADLPFQNMNDAIARAEAHAPYLRGLMRRFPEVTAALPYRLDFTLPVPTALRRAKGQLALAVALGDLSGQWSLEQVTHALTDFADQALDLALGAAFDAVVPGEPRHGFAIIALGKQGSRELNYSSDLDPMLIFDPATLPCRGKDEPVETAVRIARKLVEIMQARDGDGYVFRMDLRLRPNPEVTPIALPVEAAIQYYESQALAWERAAFIRARACAGDKVLGQRFLETIQPFVWRRGLDFGAIAEIRGISRRIRDHYAQSQALGPGFDLKRGRGGIRECEFFAQIHQMIHGGRDPALRVPGTVEALGALATAGWIPQDDALALSEAYRLYRTIEHRLQMVDDQQTHSLPTNAEALDNVSHLHGFASGQDLLELLALHVEKVGAIYDRLDSDAGEALPTEAKALATALADAGLADTDDIARRIVEWRGGTIRALRSPAARTALEAALPAIVRALSAAADPRTAFNRLGGLIERLPSAINLFRLFEARPQLLAMLADILCHAPALAAELSRRADLLEGLIDATALEPAPAVVAIAARLAHPESEAGLEAQLDRVRHLIGEARFALGVQIVSGAGDPLEVCAGYARLGEAAVNILANVSIAAFEAAHGRVPDSELIILALGRLGGGELTHASDLDLIYLFTGDYRAESDGAKPLGAVHYFNRLAQRVTAALSVPTASGALYEVDTRLRPSGAKGPLAVSLEGFARYQQEEAWTWEHLALTRARVIYGSPRARAETDAIIRQVLEKPRDPATLIADTVKMRAEVATHKPPISALDIKLGDGGLIDLEFAVQLTQLRTGSGFSPATPEAMARLGWPASLIEAHALLTRFLVTMRLIAPDLQPPSGSTRSIVARACGTTDWESLLAQIEAARQEVRSAWAKARAGLSIAGD